MIARLALAFILALHSCAPAFADLPATPFPGVGINDGVVAVIISHNTQQNAHLQMQLKASIPVSIKAPLPTTNPAADAVNKIIQAGIYDVALNAFYAYIITQVPFLAYPIISTIVKWVLNYAAGYFYQFLATAAVITVINIQTDSEVAVYNRASSIVAAAVQSKDQGAINEAQLTFEKALAGIVNFDGITSISH